MADIVAKVFSGWRTTILRPVDALYVRRREGPYVTDLRSGVERRRSSREVQRSPFARILGMSDFRLLQQYRHKAGVPKASPDVRFRGDCVAKLGCVSRRSFGLSFGGRLARVLSAVSVVVVGVPY